jgi:hypothetical protein
MNRYSWMILLSIAALSAHIHMFAFSIAAPYSAWVFEEFLDARYLAVALHLSIGTAFSALLTVIPVGLVVTNRETLVPGLLALLPYLVSANAFIRKFIVEDYGNTFFAVVMGLELLLIPLFYLLLYRLVSKLGMLLTHHTDRRPSDLCRT